MLYHVNPKTGNAARCRATRGNCPFGDFEQHYPSLNDAAKAWEEKTPTTTFSDGFTKKTIILSDIDGTLLRSSLVLENASELHEAGVLDLGDGPAQWRTDVKNETFITALADNYRTALAGKTVAFVKAEKTLERLLASDDNFYSTLKKLIAHKAQGHEVVLISGSPDFLVKPFAEHFGFKYHASNYLKDDMGNFTGEIELMAGAQAKQAVINDLMLHDYDDIVGIGDTASDAPLLEVSGKTILVEPTNETLELFKSKGIHIDEIIRN